MPRILIFRSCDDSRFDRYIGVPETMTMFDAVPLADAVVREAKETNEDWEWEQHIEPALVAAGFIELGGWSHCNEEC